MPLAAGTELGTHKILALLGVGGMGEVYQAHDTKLRRDVAIKVLPESFARDADRLARFGREAQLLASLNHTNIATIYNIEDFNGTTYLVMELVPGENLAERIKRDGAVPVEEALTIAKQVAEALEAAHEKGIIHRDLKPANVKLTPEGKVKVLDFGLAKAFAGDTSAEDMSNSPTLSMAATMQGVILGTAAYMSPEQAKGKQVDKRTDIFAFGAVLYELLTGKQAFHGEDVGDILAAVVRAEPDWNLVPAATPVKVRDLLRRCLQKDKTQRFRDAGDARIEIEDAIAAPKDSGAMQSAPAKHSWRDRLAWPAVAAALLLALASLSFVHFRERALDEPVLRLSVALPEDSQATHFTLSPDGRRLAIALLTPEKSGNRLWLRTLDSPQLQPLSGTDNARTPFWSPDGRRIGFFADGKLKIISATGGPAQVLCNAGLGGGGAWNRDGVILFSPERGPLFRVPAAGGECTPATKPESGGDHMFPVFLPDGKHFFFVVTGGDEAKRGIYLASLDDLSGHRLLADVSSVVFVPSAQAQGTSNFLFLREETLMAQPFNVRTLQLAGDAFPVADQASVTFTRPQVAATASENGMLVYLAGATRNYQYTWFDRSGKELGKVGSASTDRGVWFSPDDKTIAIPRAATTAAPGLWLRDLTRNVETRLVFPPLLGSAPVWSPDGSRIVFSSGVDLYRRDASGGGQEEVLLPKGNPKNASDWSRDGRFLLYTDIDPTTLADIWILPDPLGKPGANKPFPFLKTQFIESQAQFSPDGRWIAYTSNESGRGEVYVRSFSGGPAGPSGKWQVSRNGGRDPRWRRDGKELFYLEPTGTKETLMSVPIQAASGSIFETGAAKPLFAFPVITIVPQSNVFVYGVSGDGQRFLASVTADSEAPTLNVIVNWNRTPAAEGQ